MAKNEAIVISLDNFEEILKKYNPLLQKTATEVRKSYMLDARLEHEDLTACGAFALYKAVQTFNPDDGAYFGHYAKICVLNEMRQHARIHLPHIYTKDGDTKHSGGTQRFKRISVSVGSIDAPNFIEGFQESSRRKSK